jgi:parallel beta-helix repeat protein
LSNREYGARLDETSNNQLLENVIKGNGDGGVLVDTANRNNISENQITNAHSVRVVGDGNRLEKNEITGSRSTSGGGGIAIYGDNNTVRRNEVFRGTNAVAVAGDENLIERNSLASGLNNGVVVLGNANQIARNDIGLFSGRGIWLRSTDGERDNVLSENEVKRNKLDGILIDSRTSRVIENDSSTNGGDGIDVNGDHTLLNDNNADDNHGWGIIADVAGTQGSGNDVSGNGHSCRPAKLCA